LINPLPVCFGFMHAYYLQQITLFYAHYAIYP
jgi:hypothetical protein